MPNPWLPLLRDNDAQRAGKLAWGILQDLSRALPPSAESPPGLSNGTAGAALLCRYSALAWPADGDELHALEESYHDAALEGIAGRASRLALFDGLSGLAWLNEHLAQAREDIGPEADDDNDDFETFLQSTLAAPWTGHYDLAFGLVGLGVYACERARRGRANAIELVIRQLIDVAQPVDDGLTWFTPPELLHNSERALSPHGHYNLGLAHGVPGVVALLARALRLGIRSAAAPLAAATRWLRAQAAELASATSRYGYVVGRPGGDTRAAWCYGDPGVGLALLAAADALGDAPLRQFALDMLVAAVTRTPASAQISDAAICHGAAGLALICARTAQVTQDPRLAAAAQRWANVTMDYHSPSIGVKGFALGAEASVAHRGLLAGAAGIALVLIALSTIIEPAWDRCLLIGGD